MSVRRRLKYLEEPERLEGKKGMDKEFLSNMFSIFQPLEKTASGRRRGQKECLPTASLFSDHVWLKKLTFR